MKPQPTTLPPSRQALSDEVEICFAIDPDRRECNCSVIQPAWHEEVWEEA